MSNTARLNHFQRRVDAERKIALATIEALFNAGFCMKVDDGEGDGPQYNGTLEQHQREILPDLFAVDTAHLIAIKNGQRFGWVFFVMGNDGWDVVSDYTTNLEDVMKPVNELADKLCTDMAEIA